MSEQAASAKVCSKCGQDVSGKPRSKDAQGRYVCADCAKGDAAPAAKAAPKPVAKAPSAGDNAFLLDLGGKPLTVNLCPNCQQPMKEGAKLCTLCGFDQAEGRALRTRITKEKAPKAERAVGSGMTPGQKAFGIAVLPSVLGIGVYFGLGDVEAFYAGVGFAMIVGLGASIWAVVAAFKMDTTQGLICLFFPPYFVFAKAEDTRLKGAYGGFLVALLACIVAGVAQPPPDDAPATSAPPAQRQPAQPAPSAPKAPSRTPAT